MLGNDNSSAFEAEVDDSSIYTEGAQRDIGVFDSPEAAVKSTTPAPLFSSDRGHDIDSFTETGLSLQLTEPGASIPDLIHRHNPSSRLSSKLLHDHIDIKGFYTRWARSDSTYP